MKDQIQFRIIAASYEHSLLCLSVTIPIHSEQEKKEVELERASHFQPIFHFSAHSLSIRTLDIAKRYLVTGSNDEHIRIYDLQKRKELGTLLQHQGSITKLYFSNEVESSIDDEHEDDGKDTESTFPLHKKGKWLLSASEDGTIMIWRTKDWEKFGILKGHRGSVEDLAIHPTGRIAISVGSDATIRLWNLMTAKKAGLLKIKGALSRGQLASFIKFSLTGDHFVIGFRDRLMFYDTRKSEMTNLLSTNRKVIMAIDFFTFKNVEYIIIAFNDGSLNFYEFTETLFKSKKVSEIDGSTLEQLPEPTIQLQGHASRVKDFSIFEEIRGGILYAYMVSISSDGKIVVWDLNNDKIDQVAVYSTGERLNVVGTIQESIEKTNTMKPIYNPDDVDVKEGATDSEFESDGESLAHLLKGRKKKISNKKKKKWLKVEVEK
ncbi:hypothetical protein CANINC_001966 [Pichia inconspicua]|uniref:Anaphase-promoting complex subunit 4 WD40 domain-containing protein n=1 Tax=Pichia inconspicua TaxID=52247 RepID=A0A4T0X2E5_9ASCO|nr:hypothetical protein CANINC_001966 [[Candida] inconspicua]